MPGITGIIKFNTNKEKIRELTEFLSASLVHKDWQKSSIDYYENYGFGKVDLEEIFYPLLIDKGIIVSFYGQAVGYRDFETGTQIEININDSSDILSKKIIEAYKLGKLESFIPSINGLFSFFIYDKERNSLIIGNDRYGLRPIYYRKISDGIIFSSELKGLIEIKQKIENLKNTVNEEAIIEHFTFQHLFGAKTMIKEISLFSPASILKYSDDEISLTNYWQPQFKEKRDMTEKEAIEGLDEKIKKAVERKISRNQKDIGIGLSGGLDSRIILDILEKLKGENKFVLRSFNYGMSEDNLDSLFSKRLANLYGIVHEFIRIGYKSCLEKGLASIGPEYSGFDFRFVPFYEEVRRKGIKDVFSGEFGDCSFGKDIEEEFKNAIDITTFSEILFNKWNRIIPHKIQKQFFKEKLHPYIDLSKETFLNLVKKYEQPSFVNTFDVISVLDFERRHCGITSLAAKDYVQIHSPYLDYDFQDFIYKLPLSYRFNESIIKKYIKEKLPIASSVPRNTLELFGNESIFTKIWVNLLKTKNYVSSILFKIFRKEIIKPINMKAVNGRQVLVDNSELVKKILLNGEKCLWKDFLNEEFVSKILEKDPKRLKNWEIYLIDKLIMFEFWLKKIEIL
ncbi:asparagine synthase [Patescibacteria group bacterium]|nr:asparagine synthase [Patescibacteria group bacterium]